jgi:hypothetical protein
MDGTCIRQRLIALVAAYAVVLQTFMPFAALAAMPVAGGDSVICSSAAPSGGPAGHHNDCSCAAGCGICCAQMPAILVDAAATPAPRLTQAADVSLRLAFQIPAVRFAPQAARPPPLG